VFFHTDMLLHDVYGMFRSLPPVDGDGGGGNFSIALVLLCILDGLAAEVWPSRVKEQNQEKRFKHLIRVRLPWGNVGKSKWAHKGIAADKMYTEFRNPLVHELGADNAASRRPRGFGEPTVGKWGNLPEINRDIAKIDASTKWDDDWPILSETENDLGEPRYKLALAPLYWGVKQVAKRLM
jgi:hypothetical protein